MRGSHEVVAEYATPFLPAFVLRGCQLTAAHVCNDSDAYADSIDTLCLAGVVLYWRGVWTTWYALEAHPLTLLWSAP